MLGENWQIEDQEPPVLPLVRGSYEGLREHEATREGTMFVLVKEDRLQRMYFYHLRVSGEPWFLPYRGLARRFKDLRLIGRWAEFLTSTGIPAGDLIVLALPEKIDLEYRPFLLRRNGQHNGTPVASPQYLGRVRVDWRSEYHGAR